MFMEANRRGGIHYGFLILLCCCIISATSVSLAFGCAGIFYTPVSEFLGVSTGVFAIYATIQSLVSGFAVRALNPIVDKVGMKKVVTGLLIIQIVCYFAMGHFTKVWMFYIYGVLSGFVQSLMPSMVATISLNKWFKSNVGTFIGFSSSMTGISGMIINPIAGVYMQQHGWQATYTLYGIIIAVTALPAMLFIYKNDPADKGLLPYESKKQKVKKSNSDAGVRYELAVASRAFVLTLLGIMSLGAVSNFVPYIASYATSIGMTMTAAASLAGISQFGSLIGKNCIGIIADKAPRLLVVLGPLVPCAGLVIMLTVGKISPTFMTVGAALFGVIYGSTTVGNTLVVMHVFGARDFMKIFGTMCMFTAVSSAVSNSMWGLVADSCGGDYTVTVLICIILCLFGCVMENLAFNEAKKLPREVRQVTM